MIQKRCSSSKTGKRSRCGAWLWGDRAIAVVRSQLVAATAAGLADQVRLVDAQRHELLAGLAAAQRAALAEPDEAVAGLLLEGVVLRLQLDLRWLEACAHYWNVTKGRS